MNDDSRGAYIEKLEQELKLLREEVLQGERTKRLLQRSTEQLKRSTQQQVALRRELEQRLQELERANAAAQVASRAKSDFLSTMSHELRTPMNAILGFAQLLESDPDHPLAADQVAYVRELLTASKHLLSLIDEMLELARIDSGHPAVSLEPVALDELLEESVQCIRPLAQERAIRVGLHLASRGLRIRADPAKLLQVLKNLLLNAIKYNRPGGEVTLETVRKPGDRLEIAVADTGSGLTPEQQATVFEPFTRYCRSVDVRGVGIGLTISRRLVQAMGGEMGLVSTPGVGSRFWFVLPLVTGADAEQMAVAGAAEDGVVPSNDPPVAESA